MLKDKPVLPPSASPARTELPASLLREIGTVLGSHLAKGSKPEPGVIAWDKPISESYDD